MSWEDAPRPGRLRRWLPASVIALSILALGGAALASRTADGSGQLAVGPQREATGEVTADDRPTEAASLPSTLLDPMEVRSELAGRGPLLDGADGLTLAAGHREQLVLVDVTSGDQTQYQLPRSSRPPPGLGAMFTVGTDLVINHHGAVLRIAKGERAPVLVAEGRRALPTHRDDGSVWMTDGLLSAVAATAVRVAPDGTVLERVDLPAIARPVTGTAQGLVVSTPGGISVISADGAEELTAAGDLVAADGEHIAWVDCESGVQCVVVLGTVDDPDRARIPLQPEDVPAGYFGLPTGVYSPDGRWLAFPLYRVNDAGTLERPWITVVDTATAAESFRIQGPYTQAFSTLPLAWSPDSRWLFGASRDGITAWDTRTQQATPLTVDIEPPRGLAVIP